MIPKVFHYIWVGPPMPEHLQSCIQTWKDLHPDWDFKKWDDGNLDWLKHKKWFDAAPQLVGPNEVGQLRSDIARLEILWRYGGVYIDCDLEALKSIDELCDVDGFAGFEDENSTWVNNAIIGVGQHHPFIGLLLESLNDILLECKQAKIRRPSIMTGPQWITPLWREYGNDTLKVYPQHFFYPYAHNELDRYGESFPDAYTVHHWHHQRTIRNRRI